MQSKAQIINNKRKAGIENIVFILLCVLTTYPLFLRGLFFEKELIPTLIFCFGIAVFWQIVNVKNSQYVFIKTPVDFLALGIVLMYLISILYGVNKRSALIEFMKYASFFSIFILSRDILKDDIKRKVFVNTILLSAVVVSIVGIGSAIGTWNYNGAFESGRLCSTFQYPNTLASYVGSLYFLCLAMLMNAEKKVYKGIYGSIMGIFLFTLILTYSRGMWLLFPMIFLIFFILIPSSRKLEALLYSKASGIASMPFAFLFTSKLKDGNKNMWLYFILALLVSEVLVAIVSTLDRKLRQANTKKVIIFIVVIVCALALFVVYIFNSTTSLLLANTTDADALTGISRNINTIAPNSNYELKVKCDGTNPSEKPSVGRVRIYGVDGDEKLTELNITNIVETGSKEVNIPFVTDESTKGLKIFFENYYSNTSIEFKEANILNKQKSYIENIPLKYKFIPESIISRINSIGLKEHSAFARVAFYKDAFKVIKDYFIFGSGGGGWKTLYQKYQSYPYFTTEAHNFFLQLWIEVGIIGVGLFVALLVYIYKYVFKQVYKFEEAEENKVFELSVLVTVLSILSHASMDFDLSLNALTFILWSLMGISYSYVCDKDNLFNSTKKVKGMKNSFSYMYIILCIILIVVNSSFLCAIDAVKESSEYNNNGDIDNSIKYMEKASSFDRFRPEYKIDLANLYMKKFQDTQDVNYLQKSKGYADEYVKLGEYDLNTNVNGTSFYLGIGLIDEGLDLIDKGVEFHPLNNSSYIQKCDAYLAVFNYYYQKQDYEKAKNVMQEALKVKEQIKDANQRSLLPLEYNEDLVYKIGEVQFYNENFDKINSIFGKGYSLNFAYYFDLDINNDENIDMLYTWSTEGGNVKYDYMEDQKDKFIRITNDGEKYGLVYPYGIKLEPNTEYLIQFDARGTVGENKFGFYVIDSEAENKQLGSLENIKLTNDWGTYELKITTGPDAAPGKQYLGFQHNGSDNGYIDLRKAVIFKK